MLTLHRESRTIVTDENFSVKLKWVNPCCFMDTIPGDVGLGLEITVNEYTRAEFGNPHRFEKLNSGSNDRKFSDVAIRFSGVLLMRGTFIITGSNSKTYSGWLQSDVGVLGTKQRDKFITDMALPSGIEFENKPLYDPKTDDYGCVTVQNPLFWEGKGKSEEFPIDYTDEFGNPAQTTVNKTYLTRKFETLQSGRINRLSFVDFMVQTDGEACVVSPYLSLNRTISEIFRLNGFFIDHAAYDALGDYDYFSLLIYNNYNIFKQTFTTGIEESGYFDQILCEWVSLSIYEVKSVSWEIGPINYADLLPQIAMKDFLLWIQNFLNIAFHFQNQNIKVVNRNDIPDATPYSLNDYFLEPWSLGERKDVKLKFITENDQDDELNSDWHDLTDREADFGAPVEDITALLAIASPQLGELRLVTSLNKIYEYKWSVFDGTDADFSSTEIDVLEWIFVSTGNQPFLYGNSEEIEEIKTGCSTLQYNNDGALLYPVTLYTKQIGNLSSSRSLWSNFSLRVIHYDRVSLDRNTLEFAGENGLFARRWEKWARFWKSRLPVEASFMLPLNELVYVVANITQPYSTRHGKFIIEEIECDFQGAIMGTVKISGYKL